MKAAVFKKLLAIPERLHTVSARAKAERRVEFLQQYLRELRSEIEA